MRAGWALPEARVRVRGLTRMLPVPWGIGCVCISSHFSCAHWSSLVFTVLHLCPTLFAVTLSEQCSQRRVLYSCNKLPFLCRRKKTMEDKRPKYRFLLLFCYQTNVFPSLTWTWFSYFNEVLDLLPLVKSNLV